ncbi:MAG: hypothetical protein AB8G96_12060 [Phycisphaerales bacterium]
MSETDQQRRVSGLMERFEASSDAFEREQLAAKALRAARDGMDLRAIPAIAERLAEVRTARRQRAIEADALYMLDEPFDDETPVLPGLYLLEPPLLVGADARRLRLMAFEQQVPAMTLCREPITRLGQCPLVAIAPGATMRTRIDPPDGESPLEHWVVQAYDELGRFAIGSLDPEIAAIKRLDQLLDRSDALPEHGPIYDTIATVAIEAAVEEEDPNAPRRRRTSRKTA